MSDLIPEKELLKFYEEKRNKYKKNMYKTKKARINAAQRLLNDYWFTQFSIILFSVLLIVLTIFDLDTTNSKSVILLVVSIIVTVFSVYGTAKNYQERYIRMKDNYVRIGKIESKLDICLLNVDDIYRIENAITEYNDILDSVENHEEIDHLKSKLDDESCEAKFKLVIKYYWLKLLKNLPRLIIILLWIGIVIIFFITNIFKNLPI